MFLYVFSICLIILIFVTFRNKKYPNLFITSIIFLPDFYGIEISSSFPLITAARIMYCIFFIYVLKNKRRKINFSKEVFITIWNEYKYLLFYFTFRIISNIYYIPTNSYAVKEIFSLIFEQMLLLIGVFLLDLTNDEILSIIKTITYTAYAFFIMGILESITFFRPFDYLYTVSRYMLNDHYIRLGFLRATTTFGIPNFYGNMCILVLPLILFLYNKYSQNRYILMVVLVFFAIIHSGCRSDIIFFIFIVLIYFIFLCRGIQRKKKFLKHLFFTFILIILIISSLSFISPYYKYFYLGTVKSVLNEFGFSFNLNENVPAGVIGYGANSINATHSRLFQLSGILYALKINLFFGLGAGAEQRNEIMYYSTNVWKSVPTFDMGYVQIIIKEGLIGFMGYISLFYFMIKKTFTKQQVLSTYSKNLIIILVTTYLLCMLSSANMYSILLLYIILIIRIDSISI